MGGARSRVGGQFERSHRTDGWRRQRRHSIDAVQRRISFRGYSRRYCHQRTNCDRLESWHHDRKVVHILLPQLNNVLLIYLLATRFHRPKNIPVYNVTCCESQKKTWQDIIDNGKNICYAYPFEAGLWYPDGNITTSQIVHTLNVVFFHWLPAYLIDFLLLCFGQKRL